MKVIHVPHRVNMEGGNKPSDGEVKVTLAGQAAKKKIQAHRTPSGSRRPRNRGRG